MDDMNPGKTVVLLFLLITIACVDCAILTHKSAHYAPKKLQKISINDAKQMLHRQRRAASNTASGLKLEEVVLNGTEEHQQAYVHWSGKPKSDAVFILTVKYNSSGAADSQLWKSSDYGSSYSKLSFPEGALISYFFVSPADHNKMVFTDMKNKKLYVTSDEMRTKQVKTLPASTDNIMMHDENSGWMLLYDYFQRKLYVTMDFGSTWKLMQTGVNSRVFWGIKGYDDPHIVHMEVQPEDSEQSYYKRCTVPDCKGQGDGIDNKLGPFSSHSMELLNKYIFVQKSKMDGTDSHMMVSYMRGNFTHTYFPDSVQVKDVLILDAEENQVFVAVNHGNRMGVSLYLSDPTGSYYVLSLSNVHHVGSTNWFDVDMHRVGGLNGTYLANQQVDSSSLTHKRLKTLISYDKGGTWLEVPSPKPNCVPIKDDCALVLRLDMSSYFNNWILSEEKAPGFIIAHGHYGRSYDLDLKNMSVLVSVDGGWTWSETPLRGVYHFNILDQGSLVTAIKTSHQDHTHETHYSYDEGSTWHVEQFRQEELSIDGVLNEPGINTLVVSIYGHANTTRAWIMIKMNFSQVLSRKCNNATDYVSWMPSDHDKTLDENCLLGQQISYWRRKRTSQCFNGEQFERKIEKRNCPCGAEDFECDFGFHEQGDNCVQESWFNDSYIAPTCVEQQLYNKSRGYRKVGSDKCEGGVESDSKYQPDSSAHCPLVAPAHLLLVTNVSIVATGKPVHFHLSQKRGSIHTTKYTWNFNTTGIDPVTLTSLDKAQQQVHSYSKAGIYYVNVTAQNAGKTVTSNVLRIRVEDMLRSIEVFRPLTAKVGFPVTVSASADIWWLSSKGSSLHYIFRFGDEKNDEKEALSWNANLTHMYNKSGTYTLSVTAVNSVSAVTKQVPIKVISDGVMLQFRFSHNVDRLFRPKIYYVHEYALLEYFHQELTLMLGLKPDRLAVSFNSTSPLRINVLVVPRQPNAPATETGAQDIVQTFINMAGNKTFSLFRSLGLPKSFGDVNVTSVTIVKGPSGGDQPKAHSGANYRAVYIAVPIVLLTGIVSLLVLIYYRRRYRGISRYSLVNQHEDTDALLDDDDEPPLDLRSDNRDDPRSRDDNMLDLGSGSHLVMVTGSGGGDGAENC